MENNNTLTSLNLAYNLIGPEGAKAIGDALKASPSSVLTRLNLANCSIATEGLLHLCKALETNTSITHIYLGNNKIGDSGDGENAPDILSNSLDKNTTVTHVDLEHNNLQPGDKTNLQTRWDARGVEGELKL